MFWTLLAPPDSSPAKLSFAGVEGFDRGLGVARDTLFSPWKAVCGVDLPEFEGEGVGRSEGYEYVGFVVVGGLALLLAVAFQSNPERSSMLARVELRYQGHGGIIRHQDMGFGMSGAVP